MAEHAKQWREVIETNVERFSGAGHARAREQE
jgi:hypothetical protein